MAESHKQPLNFIHLILLPIEIFIPFFAPAEEPFKFHSKAKRYRLIQPVDGVL